MGVLLVMIMTSGSNPEVVAYDQGWFTSWSECTSMGKAMTAELEGNYNYVCVEWKKKK